jgi:large subunit ribosomal protein L14e
MLDIGRVCLKTAGRDAGKKCVIVDILDKNFVMIDGETRRRKTNISHLEPLDAMLEIEKGADNAAVVAAMRKSGIEVADKKPKAEAAAVEKPKKVRKVKASAKEKPAKKK